MTSYENISLRLPDDEFDYVTQCWCDQIMTMPVGDHKKLLETFETTEVILKFKY